MTISIMLNFAKVITFLRIFVTVTTNITLHPYTKSMVTRTGLELLRVDIFYLQPASYWDPDAG
jgi:hypothetical protein